MAKVTALLKPSPLSACVAFIFFHRLLLLLFLLMDTSSARRC